MIELIPAGWKLVAGGVAALNHRLQAPSEPRPTTIQTPCDHDPNLVRPSPKPCVTMAQTLCNYDPNPV